MSYSHTSVAGDRPVSPVCLTIVFVVTYLFVVALYGVYTNVALFSILVCGTVPVDETIVVGTESYLSATEFFPEAYEKLVFPPVGCCMDVRLKADKSTD